MWITFLLCKQLRTYLPHIKVVSSKKMKPDKEKLWNEVLESIKVTVSPAIFSTWLNQTHLFSLRKTGKRYLAEIGCSSTFVKATIERRYFGLIQDALIKALESPSDLIFIVREKTKTQKSKSGTTKTPLFEENSIEENLIKRLTDAKIRPGFTFKNFAVSSSNQMAYAAAEAVANRPGTAYNPLFIWGGVGVGKTHLMHAIGHHLLETNIDSKIISCTGEDFTNDIVEGIRNKTTQAFRNKYRKSNALFIDDIQFIAGKDAVQNEFFHTFNAVTTAGGQIILTSDKPPGEIALLEDRLKSRFEAGLIVDIAPPDFELRCAIVQIKAAQNNIDLPIDLVHLIAGNINTARKIEGFIIRFMSELKIKGASPNEDLVMSIIGRGVGREELVKKVSPDEVIDAVCKHYSISRRAMMGRARSRMIARPRQILMYLLRTELNIPLEEVGNLLGGRDHSTIIHGVDKITSLASTDVNIREDILHIKNAI